MGTIRAERKASDGEESEDKPLPPQLPFLRCEIYTFTLPVELADAKRLTRMTATEFTARRACMLLLECSKLCVEAVNRQPDEEQYQRIAENSLMRRHAGAVVCCAHYSANGRTPHGRRSAARPITVTVHARLPNELHCVSKKRH